MKHLLIALLSLSFVNFASALDDYSRVPVLLYHSWNVKEPCERLNNDLLALEEDLELIHEEGYTIVPLYWIVEWFLGWRDGSTLPDKVVGLTFDDGHDNDFLNNVNPHNACDWHKSAYTVLSEFKEKYKDELPEVSPHASVFVIGSRLARDYINPARQMSDNWWGDAHTTGIMEIYNHGIDHDHPELNEVYDEELEIWYPVSGYDTTSWVGELRPDRIVSRESNDYYITLSAELIYERIGVWPDLFAYPMGLVSDYTKNVFFPNWMNGHGTVAAFCTRQRPLYITKGESQRFCLPRLTYGADYKSADELRALLQDAAR